MEEEEQHFPHGINLHQDTGFQGHQPENVRVIQPMKKPRGKALTELQKLENKQKSSLRVIVEHAIGSVKIYRIVKETIRVRSHEFRDIVMDICCGLHNFKIHCKFLTVN